MSQPGGTFDPYVRVKLQARLMHPWWRRRFGHFGADSFLYRPEWLFRPWQMSVGEGTWILQHAWLEIGEPAWNDKEPVLRIGDRVSIRHHFTASAAQRVVI